MTDILSSLATWNNILFISLLNSALIFSYIKFNKYNLISVSNFFLLSFWICFFVGFLLAFFSHNLLGDYSLSVYQVFITVCLISICLYLYLLVFFVFDLLIPQKRLVLFKIPNSKSFIKILSSILFITSVLSIFIYVWKNQGFVLLKSTGYLDRYEANRGLGLITLLIKMYIPAIILFYLLSPTKSKLLFSLLLAIGFGLLSYLAMGGYRQILIMGVASLIFHRVLNDGISFFKTILYSTIGVVSLYYLALLRYNINIDDTGLGLLIGFTQDSLSPFNSFTKIFEYINTTSEYQNFKLFLGHFQIMIPRILWEGKPELILNSGNYYTQHVINYESTLTISPTLAGELYLMRGFWSLFIGFGLIAIMNVFLERIVIYYKESNIHTIVQNTFFLVVIFNAFWLVREGLEVYIYRMFRMYVLFWVFIVLTYFIYFAFKKDNN
tara:strand:+ start:69150 stop:70466 length:1317 start_codon:yes stop_codon:yes gene_type:complete